MLKHLVAFIPAALLLLAGLTLAGCASGSPGVPPQAGPVVLAGQVESYPLGRYLDLLTDPTGQLTLADVTGPAYAAAFSPSQADVPNLGTSREPAAVWVRFRVRNNTAQAAWMLALHEGRTGVLDLYYPDPRDGTHFVHKQTGTRFPMSSRDVNYHQFFFNLPLPSGAEQTVYLRLQDNFSMQVPLTLWQPAALAGQAGADLLLAGLLHGMMLVMAGYNLFLFLSLRERSYLYLGWFILVNSLLVATRDGLTFQYLGPTLASDPLYFLIITNTTIPAVFFTQTVLSTRSHMPRLHLALTGLALLSGLIAAAASLGAPFTDSQNALIALAEVLLLSLVGILAWRRGYRPARYYLAATVTPILIAVLFYAADLGWLPRLPFLSNGQLVGLVLMALLFSMALADRIHRLRQDTEAANRALRASQEQLRQFLDAMPVGVTVYDQAGAITYLNDQARRIFAVPGPAEAPRPLTEAVQRFPRYKAGTDQPYPVEEMPSSRALAGEKVHLDDLEIRPGGKAVIIEAWGQPITADGGQVPYAVLAFQDITRRRQAEWELSEYRERLEELVAQRTAELVIARDEAEAANRAKSAFLANISHELRTPLGLVEAAVNTLRSRRLALDETTRSFSLDTIADETRQLTGMVDNLLTASRLEQQPLNLSLSQTDVAAWLHDIVVVWQTNFPQRQFNLRLPAEPVCLLLDPVPMQLVLRNLLQNAVKYSPPDSPITVTLTAADAAMVLAVQDQGYGISPTDQPHIFERFYRGDPELTHTIRGAGLGLAICREIVTAHDGRIWLESQVDQGSTFYVQLPRQANSQKE